MSAHPVRRASRIVQALLGGCLLVAGSFSGLVAAATATTDLGVSVGRDPGRLPVGDISTFTLRLTNNLNSPLTQVAFDKSFTGAGITIVGIDSNSCGGVLIAPEGGNSIELRDAEIPAKSGNTVGECAVVVKVTAIGNAVAGGFDFKSGDVKGFIGSSEYMNLGEGGASVEFIQPKVPVLGKTFSPVSVVKADQPTTLTLTIRNDDETAALALNGSGDSPSYAIQDRLSDFGLQVAPNPNGDIQCSGASTAPVFSPVLSAYQDTITAVGGEIAPKSHCTIKVDVIAVGGAGDSSTLTNTVDRQKDFHNRRGLVPANDATATLKVTSALVVEKQFEPATVVAGQEGILKIKLTNKSPLNDLQLGAFKDNIDTTEGNATNGDRLLIRGVEQSCSVGSSLSGLASVETDETVSYTSGTLAKDGGFCTITVKYTGALGTPGTAKAFTNTLNPGAAEVISPTGVVSQGVRASVNVVDQFEVVKTSKPAIVGPGTRVEFSVQVKNYSLQAQSDVTVTDALPAGMTLLATPAAKIEGSCTNLNLDRAPAGATKPIFVFGMDRGSGNTPATCTLNFSAMIPEDATASAVVNSIEKGGVCAGASSAPICNHESSSAEFAIEKGSLLLEKKFDASTKPEGAPATMTIKLVNLSAFPVTGVELTDLLPKSNKGTWMQVALPISASTTCANGTISFAEGDEEGSQKVLLKGATVPARASEGMGNYGSCSLTVNVTGAAGQYVNSLPKGAAKGSTTNAAGDTHSLESPGPVDASIQFESALSGEKIFAPTLVQPGGKATVTIRMSNSQSGVLNNVGVTDNLPPGMLVADPANAYSTCAGTPVITAAPGADKVVLEGAKLNPQGSCDLLFDVITAEGSGEWKNTIAAGQLKADGGVQNVASFDATLGKGTTGGLTVDVDLVKNTLAAPGAVTKLVITIKNDGSFDLSNLNLDSYFTKDGKQGGELSGLQIAALANAITSCPGGALNAEPGSSSLSLSGASLPQGESCTIELDVTMAKPGTAEVAVLPENIHNDQGVKHSNKVYESLQTSSSLGVAKQFTPTVIKPNERSRLRITLYNPTLQAIEKLSLEDPYIAGLVNANPANAYSTCQGTVTAAVGGTKISIVDAKIAAGSDAAPATCYLEVDVTATTEGSYPNIIAAKSIKVDGSPITNEEETTSTLEVKAPLLAHKAITGDSQASNTLDKNNPVGFTTGTANGKAGTPYKLSIRLHNPNNTALKGLAYADSLPVGLVVAPNPSPVNDCGGDVTATPSGTSVRLTGGVLAGKASCTVSVDVLSNIAGTYTNTIPAGAVTSSEGVSNEETTQARIVISTPPTVTKQFVPAVISQNGISRLTIYVNNPNATPMQLIKSMTDTLPLTPGPVTVATPANIGGTCPQNQITAAEGSGSVTLASGTQVPSGGCSIEVDVTADASGEYLNVIKAGELQTDMGNNPEEAYAPLSVSTLGFISGQVFLDNDVSSQTAYQAGIDSPLPGVSIELRSGKDCSAPLVVMSFPLANPRKTDAAGNYVFTGLSAGDYSVCQPQQPSNTLNAAPIAGEMVEVGGSQGTPGHASNPTETSSQIVNIVLANGSNGEVSGSEGNDFPEVKPASLSGSVFADQNNDGIRQGGDSGLSGVSIALKGTDWQGKNVTRVTTTDSSGNYGFTDLPPGSYVVTEPNQPAGTVNGQTIPGDSAGGKATATSPADTPSEIRGVILSPGFDSQGNNFAEIFSGRSIHGKVFHDKDVDGRPTNGDLGLGGQRIELIGVDSNGIQINTFTTTAADGSFSFHGLPPGEYTLIQPNQPMGLINSSTSAGSAGGGITENPSTISKIDLVNNAISVDNWFAEESIPGLSGTVWFDSNHDRILDAGEPLLSNWRVVLKNGATEIETRTDANGAYNFPNLIPGSGYEVLFYHPDSNTLFGRPVPNEQGVTYTSGSIGVGNPGGANNDSGTLSGITISKGKNIIEQSLPLDPGGVVYDAISRQPVSGAVVTLSGPGLTGADVLGGSLTQTTGSEGYYQFLLLGTAQPGNYSLTVTAPAGYVQAPSTLIPACNASLTVAASGNPALVQSGNQAPQEAVQPHDVAACSPSSSVGAATTQYYFEFNYLGGGLATDSVINNHIPLDPILGGAIVMTKTTPKVNVTRGELVPYVLTARNTLSSLLNNIVIEDQLPPGFKYVKGSAQIDGVPVEPELEGRRLRFPERTLNGGQTVVIKMLLVVGSGVGFNEYVNQTWALNTSANSRVSNVASATVRVVADPTFDCSDLIGTVYDDQNRNGYQDQGEPGIAGARVATPKGWLVTTDQHGRFHIACADVPSEMRGSNFILKADERSLPSGYRITTENPRVVRMTQGRLVKANFGASIHRVVRLDLNSEAFGADHQLIAAYQERLDEVLTLLYAEPSILRIAYHMPVEGEVSDARKRVGNVRSWFKKQWEPNDCCYDLQLEEEIVPVTESMEVIQ